VVISKMSFAEGEDPGRQRAAMAMADGEHL
jgi:hypothetical protein